MAGRGVTEPSQLALADDLATDCEDWEVACEGASCCARWYVPKMETNIRLYVYAGTRPFEMGL
jgi:hypothetical protein